MYKLVIADDDEILLRGLSTMFDWASLGLCLVASVDDGDKALQAVKEHKADILLTDIKMTNMDGLQLAEEIQKENLDTTVVIMSAYDDFQYAKKALRLSVEDYLVKPIDLDVLEKTMRQVLESYAKKEEHREMVQELENTQRDVMEQEFYKAAIFREMDKSQCAKEAEKFITPSDEVWELIEIVVDNEEIISKFRPKVQKLCRQRGLKWIELSYDENLICYCGTAQDREERIEKFKEECRFLAENIQLCSRISFLNGNIVENIYNLYLSYDCIQRIKGCLYVKRKVADLYEKDVEDYYNGQYALNKPLLEYLAQIVLYGQDKVIHEHIVMLENNLKSAGSNSQIMLLYALSIFLVELNKNAEEKAVNKKKMEILNQKYNVYYKQIVSQKKLSDAMKCLERMVVDFADELKEDHVISDNQVIRDAVDYIERNFGDPQLRISEVAEHVGLSQNYFSTVFKEEMGSSFKEYLIQKRMEEAQKLLLITDYASSTIATMVGYDNPTYFSTLFKQYTGVTVSRYRKVMVSE